MSSITGSITDAVTPVTLTATGGERTLIAISGTYSGVAVQFNVLTPDGSVTDKLRAAHLGGSFYDFAKVLTDNKTYIFEISGVPLGSQVQVLPTAYTSGSAAVQIISPAPSGGAAAGNPASGNPMLVAGVDGGGLVRDLLTDTGGRLQVNNVGELAPSTDQVSIGANAANGASVTHLASSAASNNATSVKASAGNVYSLQAFNFNTSSVRFLKLYNKASSPNPASDTPVMTIPIPAGNTANQPGGVVFSGPACGIAFSAGIAFALVGGQGDSDNTSIGSGDVCLNLVYE